MKKLQNNDDMNGFICKNKSTEIVQTAVNSNYSLEEYNSLVNDALEGFLTLVQRPVQYVYNKRKSEQELNLLKSVFDITKYPTKFIKNQICILSHANYKTVNVWFQNKRNCSMLQNDEVEYDKKTNAFIKKIMQNNKINQILLNISPIDLCILFYKEDGMVSFFSEFPYLKKEEIKRIIRELHEDKTDLLSINTAAFKEKIKNIIEKYTRKSGKILEEDILMYQLQEGMLLKTKIFKEKMNTVEYKKLNYLVSTDYMLGVMFMEMSKENKKMFLKIRRRI